MQFTISSRVAIGFLCVLLFQFSFGTTIEDRYADFHTSLTETHRALSEYHGGFREGYNLLASMERTRNCIKGSYNLLDNLEQYSPDEAAFIGNRTVEILPLVVDCFNLAATKIQYIPHERFRALLRRCTNNNIDKDIRFLLKLRDYCDESLIDAINSGLQDVRDSYFAIQKAI
ncbi:hypothetical protein FE257_011717 [Aspergillus nanangensis]|uniref:Secreted protein n=1 Tax=Aspergillus nanangensis TaxID=2582783 RepID=A0AAD4CVM5_ASPNN|nr:hypothetical protein FE257_011717 [Aspergillus nanangensis]